ncbi:MAG: hypothetical protein ACRENG_17770 [bacterium]
MSETLLLALKHWIRIALGPYPRLFFPLARFKEGHRAAVGKDTELIIEGFPRSGNSFAVNAFQMVQPRPVRLAHHIHAPAQVISAARRDLPILVLAREPVAAASSLVIRHPYISIRMALYEYIRFYKTIAPYRDKFVVGLFDQVTNDYGEVIKRINQRFSTGFVPFEHNEANVQKSFDMIEQQNRQKNNGALAELRIARPSPAREKLKARQPLALEVEKQQHLVAGATALFHAFAKHAQFARAGLMQEKF